MASSYQALLHVLKVKPHKTWMLAFASKTIIVDLAKAAALLENDNKQPRGWPGQSRAMTKVRKEPPRSPVEGKTQQVWLPLVRFSVL